MTHGKSPIATLLIVAMAVLLLPADAGAKKAKDPCRHVDTEEDAFGTVTTHFDEEIGDSTDLGFTEQDGILYVYVLLRAGGSYNRAIEVGDRLEIAFEDNDKLMELTASTQGVPNHKVAASQYSASVYTEWTVRYEISKKKMYYLGGTAIKAIRVWVGEEGFPRSVSSGDAKQFMEVATCFVPTNPDREEESSGTEE